MNLKKRGSITDLPLIVGGIFSIALVAIIVTFVVSSLDDEFQDLDIMPDNAKSASSKMSDDFPAVMDGGVVFIFFALALLSFVLASLIPVHPVFLIFFILEWFLLIWLGGGIANAYQAVIEAEVLSSVADKFTLTTHFFRYFPFAVGVVGAILAIIVYKVKERFV